MSDFPYTDAQVVKFREATGLVGRGILRDLHNAGITVTFPEPRFYTSPGPRSHHHIVYDRGPVKSRLESVPVAVAEFYGYAAAVRHAFDLRDRLNREASQ